MNKYEAKLANFKKALERLKEAVMEASREDASDVVRDGMILRFEFTYELAWKTTKEFLESIGIVDVNSPKAVMKEAFAQRIILNENSWLSMIHDRNMTSHVYHEELAADIAKRIQSQYVNEFEHLIEKINK
jgi:nucleotidyltransferase substrate binding protein (TIGR01987 family)